MSLERKETNLGLFGPPGGPAILSSDQQRLINNQKLSHLIHTYIASADKAIEEKDSKDADANFNLLLSFLKQDPRSPAMIRLFSHSG